ncbi:hypothetical protein KIN20_022345 [Parelaphostrongylus tenuis]|uniref:Uncharacterized protein n=1 Tax=Parelaphostrongylus tenuis TaxID=148309 RepID=A0AAD5QV47_PARTN|nr:hypothetical protein KIN20_022345 [Parelaphostrongylus tenuis]
MPSILTPLCYWDTGFIEQRSQLLKHMIKEKLFRAIDEEALHADLTKHDESEAIQCRFVAIAYLNYFHLVEDFGAVTEWLVILAAARRRINLTASQQFQQTSLEDKLRIVTLADIFAAYSFIDEHSTRIIRQTPATKSD